MKKTITLAALALAGFTTLATTAQAQVHYPLAPRGMDPRVTTAGVVTGAAATVGYFAINDWKFRKWNHLNTKSGLTAGGAYLGTSVGCAAVSPMIATVMVNRPLTAREANTLVIGCFVPIVGPLVLNALYEANPHWEAPAAPPPRQTRRRR